MMRSPKPSYAKRSDHSLSRFAPETVVAPVLTGGEVMRVGECLRTPGADCPEVKLTTEKANTAVIEGGKLSG